MRLTGATTKKAAVNEALAQVDMLRGGMAIDLDDADVTTDAQR